MKLSITSGALYIDNFYHSYVGYGNGRESLQLGRYPVSSQYSEVHGRDLPYVAGIGWIGDDQECDIVLGRVLANGTCLPCSTYVGKLIHRIVLAEDEGRNVEVVIHG